MSDLVWYVPTSLLLLLLCLLLRRKAYQTFPCFLAYVAFGVAADTMRFITLSHPSSYHSVYWATEAGYDLLGILVMYEVVRAVLGDTARGSRSRVAFPVLVVFAVALSFARAHAVPSQFGHGISFYIMVGEIAVRFIQVIVFASLVTLVPILGLRWRQYPFGVAAGFGLYSTVALLVTTKLSDFGTRFMFLWDVASVVAYSVAVLIWIWFFSVPQKVEPTSSQLSVPSPGDLNRYKDVLRRMR